MTMQAEPNTKNTSKILPKKSIQHLTPYSPPMEGRMNKVRLDFNENTSPEIELDVQVNDDTPLPSTLFNTYPEYTEFLSALTEYFELPVEYILPTNGSADALFLIPFTFIEPFQDTAIISSPTFPVIPHSLTLVDANINQTPVNSDLTYNVAGIEEGLKNKAKLCIIANPDNPTGSVIDIKQIEQWCKQFPETLFVIDEAYYEFYGLTALPLVTQFNNVLVTRSFSKAWGLAGLRLGVILGNPILIEYLSRARQPYGVNMMAVRLAIRQLLNQKTVFEEAKKIMVRKTGFIQQIREKGYSVVEGHGNFFLLKAGIDAQVLCQFCFDNNVLLRDRSALPNMEGLIRISVGTEAENEKFLDCLEQFKQQRALIFDLDDTLVDTSDSFDTVVKTLFQEYSGQTLSSEVLKSIRAEGGFNDDWDTTVELLKRENIFVSLEEIQKKGKALYLSIAKERETLLFNPEQFKRLQKRYRLMIYTGRCKEEYEKVWQTEFKDIFETVICSDDYAVNGKCLPKKPAPDGLLTLMKDKGLTGGIYVGNSVDDMAAATQAGLMPVGVLTSHNEVTLNHAGAKKIMASVNNIGDLIGDDEYK